MEEELEAAIASENYDLAAQLGLDTDALRAEIKANENVRDDGSLLSSLWTVQVGSVVDLFVLPLARQTFKRKQNPIRCNIFILLCCTLFLVCFVFPLSSDADRSGERRR